MKPRSILVSLLCTFLFAVNTIAQGAGEIIGQTTWIDGNGHRYAIVNLPGETWTSASVDIATTLPGYHLATITSQAEQDFVWDFVVATTGGQIEWWLGGFQDVANETDPAEGWEWVTGEPWVYTNWLAGEPNDAGGLEDHLALDIVGGWNDEGTALGIIKGYIAETTESIIFVIIDILPKKDVNRVSLNSRGSIQVAILSTDEFLAFNEVNPDSVTFGPDGAAVNRYTVTDVNRDGLPDMVFYFKIRETGIECGDTEAALAGETHDGLPFAGTDTIVTRGCR